MLPLIDEEKGQYFDKAILSSTHFEDGFIDAGAYNGDTACHFYEYFPNYTGTYYCFEAAEFLQDELKQTIESLHKNIVTYKYAVWDKEEKLKFDDSSFGGGGGSAVSQTGYDVQGMALDAVLQGKKISFIKMDIEGAEKNALLGAQKIIREQRPILTICIYHRAEDMFDLPLLIEELGNNGYALYVRQYRFGLSETVLYAIPFDRS